MTVTPRTMIIQLSLRKKNRRTSAVSAEGDFGFFTLGSCFSTLCALDILVKLNRP